MTNTMKHLSLLGRMETDGLMLSLTGLFSENELDGACEKVERLELQARLKKTGAPKFSGNWLNAVSSQICTMLCVPVRSRMTGSNRCSNRQMTAMRA